MKFLPLDRIKFGWLRVFLGLVMGSLILSGCSKLPFGGAAQGALQVTSNAAFNIYLNENFIGQAPFFDERIKTGEYTLRLTSSAENGDEAVWQTKLKIGKRTLTVVHYESSGNPDESTSEVLELEKLPNKDAAELALTTVPDNVVVKLDGELKGFSPIVLGDAGAGDHVLTLDAPGYKTKTINLKINAGHRLRVEAELARDPKLKLTNKEPDDEATASGEVTDSDTSGDAGEDSATKATPSPTPKALVEENGVIVGVKVEKDMNKPYVQILEASAGIDWLRVREEPSGFVDNEVAKVRVGTFFSFVERSDNNQWVKIEYQKGKEGWVSGAYVRVVD